MLELALRHGKGCVHSGRIAASQNIPESYLVQLLNQLRKAGLIRSTRGPKGGHQLLRRPEEVTVEDVLSSLEGPMDLNAQGEERSSAPETASVFREVWSDVETAIQGVLSTTTFADLVRRTRNAGSITFRI